QDPAGHGAQAGAAARAVLPGLRRLGARPARPGNDDGRLGRRAARRAARVRGGSAAEVDRGYEPPAARSLEREEDALVLQLLEASRREPVEPGRFAAGGPLLAQRRDDAQQLDLPPEVPLVQVPPEDRLVDRLQLRQRELGGQQLEADRRVLELRA